MSEISRANRRFELFLGIDEQGYPLGPSPCIRPGDGEVVAYIVYDHESQEVRIVPPEGRAEGGET